MEKKVRLADYCTACKDAYNLPQCANFIFASVCEICGKPAPIVYFHGGCCAIDGMKRGKQ